MEKREGRLKGDVRFKYKRFRAETLTVGRAGQGRAGQDRVVLERCR